MIPPRAEFEKTWKVRELDWDADAVVYDMPRFHYYLEKWKTERTRFPPGVKTTAKVVLQVETQEEV